MSTDREINNLLQRANGSIQQTGRKQKLTLYTEGLKTKMRQVEFTLACLAEFTDQFDSFVSSTGQSYTIIEKVYFYCDSFWAFLYSSLDVLGQIVNQALDLQLDERKVSIKTVTRQIENEQADTAIQQILTACIASRSFKNLDRYRNCSLHRRQIYIKEQTVRHTPGYKRSSTTIQGESLRFLCDNPLLMNPKTTQKRRIPEYMKNIQNRIYYYIEEIIEKIQPR